jgi:hypothetical protein
MVAVMVERPRVTGDEIEGRGNDLMETWALYRRDTSRLGAPHVEKMPWKERLDKALDTEPPWVLDIDDMIGDLAKVNDFYPRLVKRFWLDNQAVWEVVERLHRTKGFVLLSLRAVCELAERRVPE